MKTENIITKSKLTTAYISMASCVLFLSFTTVLNAQNIDFAMYKNSVINNFKITNPNVANYDQIIGEHLSMLNTNGQFLDMLGTQTLIRDDGSTSYF